MCILTQFLDAMGFGIQELIMKWCDNENQELNWGVLRV